MDRRQFRATHAREFRAGTVAAVEGVVAVTRIPGEPVVAAQAATCGYDFQGERLRAPDGLGHA